MSTPKQDFTGQTFGRLYVIRPFSVFERKESFSLFLMLVFKDMGKKE